ncbi:Malic acid transport [Fusarium pseudocircinatum]|uniref:Malic acid transport n=1 Tax=Fusarium pseudocircinatum TaxID=56676 RepID=A0A8H5L997_9HYPO|nr:Malic acid transport [Fusarium pseudocircinatum]
MDRLRDLEVPWTDSNTPTRRNSVDLSIPSPPAEHDPKAFLNHHTAKSAAKTDPSQLEKGSQDDSVDEEPAQQQLSLRQRLHHFTWAWFTLPMSAGGLALLIHVQPHQFPGLRIIGTVLYSINLLIFTLCCIGMICRFLFNPGDLTKSVTHHREAFLFPTFFLAIASLITSTQRYIIPKNDPSYVWATETIFWIYVVVTFILAVWQYSYLFAGHSFNLQTMMPGWLLPIFPVMLAGTVATVILDTQSHLNPLPIIFAGLTCQGLGFCVSMMMYAHMIGRLMQSGLPNREHRTGLFMNVGPPAFTALALIGMANALPKTISGADNLALNVDTVRTVALLCAVFLWALSLWWFLIAVVAVVSSPPKFFHLGWWPMVFPNTGFTLATISIGNEFKCEGILWAASGMTIILVITFLIVFSFNMRAVFVRDIMYPGKDEDADDH